MGGDKYIYTQAGLISPVWNRARGQKSNQQLTSLDKLFFLIQFMEFTILSYIRSEVVQHCSHSSISTYQEKEVCHSQAWHLLSDPKGQGP